MTLHHYPSWNRLIGALVEIRQRGQTIRIGTVEAAMPDSSVLWLASDAIHPRTMYEAALGYQAWVQPQELTGPDCYRMTNAMLYSSTIVSE